MGVGPIATQVIHLDTQRAAAPPLSQSDSLGAPYGTYDARCTDAGIWQVLSMRNRTFPREFNAITWRWRGSYKRCFSQRLTPRAP